MNRQDLIAALEMNLRQLQPFYEQPENVLNRSYAPGKWTMRQILVHLSDSETVYLDRLRRLAAEENPTMIGFDQDLWASGLFYTARNLKLAQQQFEAARRSVLELLKTLPASADARTGTHSEAGKKTFAQIAETIANHNAHHLEQIRAIAENRTWTK